ncbi:hypothetical protein [Legionella londiniensis]|uniref:hypothetical protein n=1 Tax=Legionella londiniensis TaxID=45068 RepID=UPI000730DF10|nr:hypothetical protein [Legionella londiniensis]STX93440.1 Uncharacterised protein [Legionella londiniensis]
MKKLNKFFKSLEEKQTEVQGFTTKHDFISARDASNKVLGMTKELEKINNDLVPLFQKKLSDFQQKN